MDNDFKFRGNYNKELAGQYLSYWYTEAEKRIATDAAAAKRASTQMDTTCKAFGEVLNDKQVQALQAARSVLVQLAGDLGALKPVARAYATWKKDKDAREAEQRLQEKALLRWPTDDEALAEARDLIAFYATGPDGKQVEAAILARHPGHTEAYRDAGWGDATALVKKLGESLRGNNATRVRSHAMELLQSLGKGDSHRETWYVGRADYTAWRAGQYPGGVAELAERRNSLEFARGELINLRERAQDLQEAEDDAMRDGDRDRMERAREACHAAVVEMRSMQHRVATLEARL